MKKLAALLIALLLGVSFPLGDVSRGPVAIASREDLDRIAADPGGSFVLTADIDMGEEPWTPIPFSGTLDGAGHTIGNLTVTEPGALTGTTYDGNRKQYETSFAGLFSVVNGAKIQNLNLLNVKIAVESDRNCFFGAIAGYAAGTEITNCTVRMRGTLTTTAIDVGVGGMVGFCEKCTFERCGVEAELVFIDVNTEELCEEFLGGVYACGYGTIRDCTVFTRGYADIYGYAHNGGVVGMFKLPHGYKKPRQSISGTTVDAEIRFFEITPSRRAYCKAIIGEDGAKDCYLTHNKELHFVSEESRTPVSMRPEMCENPVYTQTVTAPTCTEWGYTTFICEDCRYTYRDCYLLPDHVEQITETEPTCTQEGCRIHTCVLCGETWTETIPPLEHTPGEWIVVQKPGRGMDGSEELYCTVCGTMLDSRVIPGEQPIVVQQILLSETAIGLKAGEQIKLSITVEPADAEDQTVRFESSAPEIASVDENGLITAHRTGTATITVRSGNGSAAAYCFVTVTEEAEETEWIDTQPEEPKPTEAPERAWFRCG